MRKTTLLWASLLLFVLPVAAQEPLPSIDLPPELDRVLRDYESAWQARDAKRLAGLFTADGFVMSAGSPPTRGRDAIEQRYANSGGPLSLRALAYSLDGSTGFIIGGYASAAGKDDAGKFVLALRKFDGRWMIAADIDNSNTRPGPPPPPANPPPSNAPSQE